VPAVGAERWFHTLVVVGAALGGCGGAVSDKDVPAAGGSGGLTGTGGASNAGLGGGGSTGTNNCAYDAQFVCDDYATLTNCRCDTTAPLQKSDCASPLDFQCTRLPCKASPGEICLGNDYVGCRCDPSGLRPSDCATPEQFFCNVELPFFSDCMCVPPVSPDACGTPRYYCCQSTDPQFGCTCNCLGIR
jgi:hypothetical protein